MSKVEGRVSENEKQISSIKEDLAKLDKFRDEMNLFVSEYNGFTIELMK